MGIVGVAVLAAGLAAVLLGGGGGAARAAKVAKTKGKPSAPQIVDPAELVDVSAIRPRLILVTDGKGHYVAALPDLAEDAWRGHFFYSDDGKTFWDQRVGSMGSSGAGTYSMSFWDPRIDAGWKKSFDKKGDVFTMQCDDRTTTLTVVPAAEAKVLLDAASFRKPRWKFSAYALARDDKGTYYYVDRPREPEGNKAFRLSRGTKGALKPLKMTNVVSDSEGDIFATKGGELRLIFNKETKGRDNTYTTVAREPFWIKGKQKTALTWVPVEDNLYLIYVELGVYAGQPLGTPCDDL